MMKIPDKVFAAMWADACKDPTREDWVDRWVLSRELRGADRCDLRAYLERIWTTAHVPMVEFRKLTGLSQGQYAARFCLPAATVANWERAARPTTPPDYVRLWLAEATGFFRRVEEI